MEDNDRRLILSDQVREALALILVIVFLLASTYLLSILVMRVLPAPY